MTTMKAAPLLLALLLAPSARAETVRLFCENEHAANNQVVEVDYQSGQVVWGGTYPGAQQLGPVAAHITQYAITWNGVGSARGINYRIDRVKGEQAMCDKDGCWPKSVCRRADDVKPKF
jgi:hypothetical protein